MLNFIQHAGAAGAGAVPAAAGFSFGGTTTTATATPGTTATATPVTGFRFGTSTTTASAAAPPAAPPAVSLFGGAGTAATAAVPPSSSSSTALVVAGAAAAPGHPGAGPSPTVIAPDFDTTFPNLATAHKLRTWCPAVRQEEDAGEEHGGGKAGHDLTHFVATHATATLHPVALAWRPLNVAVHQQLA